MTQTLDRPDLSFSDKQGSVADGKIYQSRKPTSSWQRIGLQTTDATQAARDLRLMDSTI